MKNPRSIKLQMEKTIKTCEKLHTLLVGLGKDVDAENVQCVHAGLTCELAELANSVKNSRGTRAGLEVGQDVVLINPAAYDTTDQLFEITEISGRYLTLRGRDGVTVSTTRGRVRRPTIESSP